MAITVQGYGSFSNDAVTYIAQKTLTIAKKLVVFQQLGEKAELGPGSSKTFQFTRYDRLALPVAPLSEGVTPDNTSMSISTVQATADQWGAYVNISDVAELTIKHPIMVKAIELMGYQAAETVEREIIKVLMNGTSVSFPAGIANRAALSSTSTDIVSTNLIRKMIKNLRTRGAMEYDGQNFVGVVDPSVEMDLSADATFQQAASYSNIKVLLNGEIGQWMGVRWMRSNFIPTITGLAALTPTPSSSGGSLATASYYSAVEAVDATTGISAQLTQQATTAVTGPTGSVAIQVPATNGYLYNVYFGSVSGVLYQVAAGLAPNATATVTAAPSSGTILGGIPGVGKVVHFSWVFGKEAYTVVDLQKLQSFITPKASSDSDPLAQRRKAGWKLMFKAVINNDAFMERGESLSAY